MNRKLLSKALGNVDDTFIAETMSPPLAQRDRAPERTILMRKYETGRKHVRSRGLFRVVLAACLVFAMALTAYACNFFGIRDLFTKLPETADPYIQEHTEGAAAEDWSARITESLCDDTKVMVTVTVSGGDKYIIAPTDADPNTLAVNIGIAGDQTLGDYAEEQGKQLLFVGAVLQGNEALAGNGSQRFQNATDSEMTILISADKTDKLIENEIICHVYAADEEGNKLTLDIPFSLEEAPTQGSSTYIPVDADAIPGITIGEATVMETPLGFSIRFLECVTDEDAFYDIMKVEIEGMEYGEGGTVLEDDGNWYFTASQVQGALGDTLTVHFYNWDQELIGTAVFVQK